MDRKSIRGRLDRMVESYNHGRYEEVHDESIYLSGYIFVHMVILRIFFIFHFILFIGLCFVAGNIVVAGGSLWNMLYLGMIFVINSLFIKAMHNWFDDYCEVKKYLEIVNEFKVLIHQLKMIGGILEIILTDEKIDKIESECGKMNGVENEI